MNGPITPNTPIAPPPPGQVSNFNDPRSQERVVQFWVTLAIVVPLSSLCALARLWTRAVIVRQFGWDDAFALIALLVNIPQTVAWVGEFNAGVGDYDWNVRVADWMVEDMPYNLYWNSVGVLCYYIAFPFLKLSILALYLRVIGDTHRKLRIAIYVTMVLVCAIGLGCVIEVLTFCHPIQRMFDVYTPGTCDVKMSLNFAQPIMSVITDFLILIPPIPIIWRLSCSTPRKIGLVLTLCLGLVVTGICIARAVVQSPTYYTTNYPLYNQYDSTYWAILEINFAIIVVSLPALTQLFRRTRAVWGRSSNPSRSSPVGGSPAAAAQNAVSRGRSTPLRNGSGEKRSPVSRIVQALYSGTGRPNDLTEANIATERPIDENESLSGDEEKGLSREISRPEPVLTKA